MAAPIITNRLHEMFEQLQLNMTDDQTDRVRKHLCMSGCLGDARTRNRKSILPRKLYKCDAYTLFKFLERKGFVDETEIAVIREALKSVTPELYELTTDINSTTEVDPMIAYLKENTPRQLNEFKCHNVETEALQKRKRVKKRMNADNAANSSTSPKRKLSLNEEAACGSDAQCRGQNQMDMPSTSDSQRRLPHFFVHPKQSYTCVVRLCVTVEYKENQELLESSVHSNKRHKIEQQFDLFNQACDIISTRNLSSLVCDVKFADITYLDAFWRDYTNGTLQNALEKLFLTESLSFAVNGEELQLLVSIDESDYRSGRLKLMKNLQT